MKRKEENRFFHGFCFNTGNNTSHIKHFIIESVREIPNTQEGGTILETINKMEDFYFDEERIGDPFYIVYGTPKGSFNQPAMALGTFYHLQQAINFVEKVSGHYIRETDHPVYRVPEEEEE